jgi:hypothetical protein
MEVNDDLAAHRCCGNLPGAAHAIAAGVRGFISSPLFLSVLMSPFWQKAHRMYGGQIFFFPISSAIYSARMARDTIVKVGFSAPSVVNWLPSEMNRFLTS